MLDIAIRRLRVLPLCPTADGGALYREQVIALLTELAALGYRVTNPARLAHAGADSLKQHAENLRTLARMRGADRDWVPLFSGFPDKVPDQHEYLARRVAGVLGNVLGLFEEGTTLSNGVRVPDWLFDLSAFGADPITQNQTAELFAQGRAQQADRDGDTHTEWVDLELVFVGEAESRLKLWLQKLLYARSPLSEGVRSDLAKLLRAFGPDAVDTDQIALKETLAFVLRVYWEAGEVERLAAVTRSPTDLLRLFALLTDTDVSLATKIKYPRFTRAQRRMALAALEACADPLEALGRHRRLWLVIGKGLHVGEHADRYPRIAAAFTRLRQGPVPSFASHTEALIAAADVAGLLAHLSRRPGTFVRRFHELLRRFPDHTDEILAAFSAAGVRAPVRTLLVLDAHLQTINDRPRRTIINKRGKIKVMDNPTQNALADTQLAAARAAVEGVLLAALGERGSWDDQTVYIEPALSSVTVPLQQRAASDGLINLGRGSRIPVDLGKVLRLFVYWKQAGRRTDLDLSCVQFDENFDYLGHVSYTNLKSGGIVHSGDITSAPHGAAEFIDITVSELPSNVRYLAPQVYRYAGESFPQLDDSFVGWMIRDAVDRSRKSFDPKTVANGYALQGTGSYALPLLVDLKTGEIILIDLYVGRRVQYNRVENSADSVSAIISELADFPQTRPTLARLAALHAMSRGAEPVAGDCEPDVSFGVREGTYAANRPAEILAELL